MASSYTVSPFFLAWLVFCALFFGLSARVQLHQSQSSDGGVGQEMMATVERGAGSSGPRVHPSISRLNAECDSIMAEINSIRVEIKSIIADTDLLMADINSFVADFEQSVGNAPSSTSPPPSKEFNDEWSFAEFGLRAFIIVFVVVFVSVKIEEVFSYAKLFIFAREAPPVEDRVARIEALLNLEPRPSPSAA